MSDKVISLEDQRGPFQAIFKRVMRMVPEREKDDKKLQRLLAFRLKSDGEAATTEYLIEKIREIIQCAYTGSFYEFLKDDLKKRDCGLPEEKPEPPGVA
jgi:hypothetical protein